MLQWAGVCIKDSVVDLLEPRTTTKLDEELDFRMWTIETGEKTPRALENNNDKIGKQRNNNEIQAIEM